MPGAIEYQFKQVAEFLREVIPQLRKNILPRHAQTLAEQIQAKVRARYRTMATPLGATSTAVALRGKEKGAVSGRPAKRPIASADPLFNRLAASLVTARLAPGHFRISIDPTAVYPQPTLRYPAGVPLGFLAWVHENRRGAVVPVTQLMLAYTRMLHEGRGGYGTRRRTKQARAKRITHNPVRGQLILFPPNRPVWSQVIAQQIPGLLQRMGKRIELDVMDLAKSYGGKPIRLISSGIG